MPLFAWTDAYNVGNELIDGQHRQLVELVNIFHEAVSMGKEEAILNQAFDHMLQYTNKHFRDEEEMFGSLGSRLLKQHKLTHRLLVDELRELWGDKRRGVLDEVGKALEKWLLNRLIPHFKDDDPLTLKASGQGDAGAFVKKR